MGDMRALVITIGLLAAAPATAQIVDPTLSQSQILQVQTEQQLARMREVAQTNELMALEARLRTEEALARIAASRAPVVMPTLPYPNVGAAGVIDISKLPSIPDAALADSNRRVQAILKNPR